MLRGWCCRAGVLAVIVVAADVAVVVAAAVGVFAVVLVVLVVVVVVVICGLVAVIDDVNGCAGFRTAVDSNVLLCLMGVVMIRLLTIVLRILLMLPLLFPMRLASVMFTVEIVVVLSRVCIVSANVLEAVELVVVV